MSGEWAIPIVIGVLGLAVGFALGFLMRRYAAQEKIRKQEQQAEQQLEQAEKQASEIMLAAKDEALKVRNTAEQELERRRSSLRREEERLQRRREKVDQRQERLEQREQSLNKRQSALDRQRNQVERLQQEQMAALERVAGLSSAEAKQELLEVVKEDSRQDMARVIRQVEATAQEEADTRARKIITHAIQRLASDQVAEITVSEHTAVHLDLAAHGHEVGISFALALIRVRGKGLYEVCGQDGLFECLVVVEQEAGVHVVHHGRPIDGLPGIGHPIGACAAQAIEPVPFGQKVGLGAESVLQL